MHKKQLFADKDRTRESLFIFATAVQITYWATCGHLSVVAFVSNIICYKHPTFYLILVKCRV